MDIYYLGHSSFRIKGKDATLVCDPFDSKMVGFKFPPVQSDIVTISHDHMDHNQAQLVKDVKKVISGPGEYEIKGISILGFRSFHDDKKEVPNTIYVFEVDGVRICHLGDLGHSLSEDLLEDLGDIDVLMIPVGGGPTIGPSQAVEIVSDIEPSIVIPMHYQEEFLNKEVFSSLAPVESFLKEIGLMVEKLSRLSVKKEELGETQKVVILERKQ